MPTDTETPAGVATDAGHAISHASLSYPVDLRGTRCPTSAPLRANHPVGFDVPDSFTGEWATVLQSVTAFEDVWAPRIATPTVFDGRDLFGTR